MKKKTKKYIKIKSFDDLLDKAYKKNGEPLDCFIGLGCIRSSKEIRYYKDQKRPWEIFHSIDGVIDNYSDEGLLEDTNIGEAIKKGQFYLIK